LFLLFNCVINNNNIVNSMYLIHLVILHVFTIKDDTIRSNI